MKKWTPEIENFIGWKNSGVFFAPVKLAAQFQKRLQDIDVETTVDARGNITMRRICGNDKIHIVFRLRPRGVMVGTKTEENEYHASMLGDVKAEEIRHRFLMDDTQEVGVLRSQKEGADRLICFEDSSPKTGDILTVLPNYTCKADLIYGSEAECEILCDIAISLLIDRSVSDKSVCFTLVNESLCGETGVPAALNAERSEKVLVLAGCEGQEGCEIGRGTATVFKDGCYVASETARGMLAGLIKDGLAQGFVGKNDRTMERASICAVNEDFLGLYLPVAHRNTMLQTVNCKDIEKTRNCLLKCICEL